MPSIVIKDTREQAGWEFPGMVIGTLHTGDYTLQGYEKDFIIERKGKLTEFANNVVDPRFERELDRLDDFKWPFLICEFEFSDIMTWPFSAKLPPSLTNKIKISKYFILKRVNEILVNHKTKILFVGKYGKETAESLFKRIETY